jgi:hypothetical protein
VHATSSPGGDAQPLRDIVGERGADPSRNVLNRHRRARDVVGERRVRVRYGGKRAVLVDEPYQLGRTQPARHSGG